MARRRHPRRGPLRRTWSHAGRARRYGRPSSRAGDWRTPVDGRAPRLGPKQYIGTDIAPGPGAWDGRDPMRTPEWWHVGRWIMLVLWSLLTGITGFLSWRRHGGKAFLFGHDRPDP
jgi:hypothetical protein